MNYLNCTPSPQSQSTAILDSGCTAHFLLAKAHCKKKVPTQTAHNSSYMNVVRHVVSMRSVVRTVHWIASPTVPIQILCTVFYVLLVN
jgi:hypothetical protein